MEWFACSHNETKEPTTMSEKPPRNRQGRQAAARLNGASIEPTNTAPTINLQQPDRSGPKSKTLLDIYEEKKAILEHGQPFSSRHDDGLVRDESGNILEAGLGGDSDPIGPVGNAIFWSLTLAMIHFTLDVLVYQQYRQEIEWQPIFGRTLVVLPVLFLMVWTMSSATAKRFPLLRQVVFLAVAVGAGCYTIHVANRYEYFAVMKQAPPLGTLWIWSVIEMRLPFAAGSMVADLAFLWYKGYSAF